MSRCPQISLDRTPTPSESPFNTGAPPKRTAYSTRKLHYIVVYKHLPPTSLSPHSHSCQAIYDIYYTVVHMGLSMLRLLFVCLIWISSEIIFSLLPPDSFGPCFHSCQAIYDIYQAVHHMGLSLLNMF